MGILPLEEVRQLQTINDELAKAYITNQDIVTTTNDGDASSLRKQFLFGNLVSTIYSQDDAAFLKKLRVENVGSTVVEFSRFDLVNGGDGFVPESGTDGVFGTSYGEDAFSRHTRTVKFMAAARRVGLVTQSVNNIANPMRIAEQAASLEIVRNMNLAAMYGDSGFNTLSFDGIEKQLRDYVDDANDPGILIDMRGGVVDIEAIMTAATSILKRFGNPSLLLQSPDSYNDTEAELLSNLRSPYGYSGIGGISVDKVRTAGGEITRMYDKMLRANRPINVLGAAASGGPRTTADTGALSFTGTPWASRAAGPPVVNNTVAAGSGSYWQNVTRNTAAALTTIPAVPVSVDGNNAQNNLATGQYQYAASIVYQGKESLPWVFARSAVGLSGGSADGTVANNYWNTTLGDVNALRLNTSAISGYAAATHQKTAYFRIYRKLYSEGASAWKFLTNVGIGTDDIALAYDNGFKIPGTVDNFLLTEQRDGRASIVLAELLAMMKRPLPNLPLADVFAMLAFATPIVFFGGFHVQFYNVRAMRPGYNPT